MEQNIGKTVKSRVNRRLNTEKPNNTKDLNEKLFTQLSIPTKLEISFVAHKTVFNRNMFIYLLRITNQILCHHKLN